MGWGREGERERQGGCYIKKDLFSLLLFCFNSALLLYTYIVFSSIITHIYTLLSCLQVRAQVVCRGSRSTQHLLSSRW